MKFTWIGGPTWLLELGEFKILCDPITPPPTLPVDLLCVTCVRPDHFAHDAVATLDRKVPIVCTGDAQDAVDSLGFVDALALDWFEETDIEKEGESLVIAAVPADSPSGADNGYFFTHDAGGKKTTAYCTGDALFSNDIRRVQQEMGYSNLLIQHLGAERDESGALTSPTAKEAMQFVYRMQPNAIAAVHHSTLPLYTEPFDVFRDFISRTIYEKRLRVLAAGESFTK